MKCFGQPFENSGFSLNIMYNPILQRARQPFKGVAVVSGTNAIKGMTGSSPNVISLR